MKSRNVCRPLPFLCSALLLLGASTAVSADDSSERKAIIHQLNRPIPPPGSLFYTEFQRRLKVPLPSPGFSSIRPEFAVDNVSRSFKVNSKSIFALPSSLGNQLSVTTTPVAVRRKTASHGLIIIPPPHPQTLIDNPTYGSKVGGFSYNETTGIINSPAARVVPAGSIYNAIEFQDTTFPGVGLYTSKADGPRSLDFANSLFRNVGDTHYIFGIGGGLELSVEAFHFALDELIFGAKWLAVADAEDHPAFAIGVQSLNAKPENGKYNQYDFAHPASFDTPSVFGVVGHTFSLDENGQSLELEAGLGTGRLQNGFASFEYHMNRQIGIAADWDGTLPSVAIKFAPSDRVRVSLDAQFQNPVRFGASLAFYRGATPDRNGPDWAKFRDKSHVPQPDVLLFPEVDHSQEEIDSSHLVNESVGPAQAIKSALATANAEMVTPAAQGMSSGVNSTTGIEIGMKHAGKEAEGARAPSDSGFAPLSIPADDKPYPFSNTQTSTFDEPIARVSERAASPRPAPKYESPAQLEASGRLTSAAKPETIRAQSPIAPRSVSPMNPSYSGASDLQGVASEDSGFEPHVQVLK